MRPEWRYSVRHDGDPIHIDLSYVPFGDRALQSIYDILRAQVPEGKTLFMDLHMTPTDKLIHLDFVKGDTKDGSKNVPLTREGTHVEYPYREVREIRVTNRGDAVVVFAVNVDGRSSTRANIRVVKNQTEPFSMNYFAVLRNMNITLERGSTQSTDVEILLIV